MGKENDEVMAREGERNWVDGWASRPNMLQLRGEAAQLFRVIALSIA